MAGAEAGREHGRAGCPAGFCLEKELFSNYRSTESHGMR